MKTNGNDKTLESFKIFPYVAWALTIGFAFFVYNIALELRDVANDLQAQAEFLQVQINASPEQFQTTDLTRPSNQ